MAAPSKLCSSMLRTVEATLGTATLCGTRIPAAWPSCPDLSEARPLPALLKPLLSLRSGMH
eukprot:14008837-Alexandrium_andersonii.AAC.1